MGWEENDIWPHGFANQLWLFASLWVKVDKQLDKIDMT